MTPAADPAAARQRLLAAAGWGDAWSVPLAGDASQRRFERLKRLIDGRHEATAVLIVSAPEAADIAAFDRIAGLLRELGLSAPAVLAKDAAAGLLLVEDFGDVNFGRLVEAGEDPGPFCMRATELLIALHRRFKPEAAAKLPLVDYNADLFLDQLMLFLDSYLPAAWGRPADAAVREGFRLAWAGVLPLAYRVPQSLLLRDFHLGNLMYLPARTGIGTCGLLDFQDAGIGPVTYDLVSLLEDTRLDLDRTTGDLLARYRAAFPALDATAFANSYNILGAMRQCRVLAVFARLAAQGRPAYLRHLPRAWRLLDRKLQEPVLAPVRAWFAKHLPPERRISAALRPKAE